MEGVVTTKGIFETGMIMRYFFGTLVGYTPGWDVSLITLRVETRV